MGSKKTVRKASAIQLFNQNDNLFTKEIIRYYSLNKNLDSFSIGKYLIFDISFFFNNKVFEKLGVIAKGTISSCGIINQNIINHLQNKGYCTNIIEYRDGFYINKMVWQQIVDVDRKTISGKIHTIKQFLDENYEYDTSYSVVLEDTYNARYYYFRYYTGSIFVTYGNHGVKNQPVIMRRTVYKYKVNPNKTDYYKFDSYTINEDGSYHLKLINENDANDIYYIDTPIDNRVYILIAWTTTGGCYNNPNNNDMIITQEKNPFTGEIKETVIFFEIFPQTDFLTEVTNYDALLIPIKKDFYPISNTKYSNIVKQKFGLNPKKGDESFEDNIINDGTVKDTFISYMCPFNSTAYKHYIDLIYGDLEQRVNKVTFSNQHFTIQYTPVRSFFNTEEIIKISDCTPITGKNINIYINDSKISDWVDDVWVIMPVGLFEKKPLKDKYQALKDLLAIYIFQQQEVKKKWYESVFVNFLSMIISAVIAITTGQFELFLLGFAGSTTIGLLVHNPKIAAILNIVFSVALGSFKNGSFSLSNISKINWAKFALQTTTDLFNARMSELTHETYEKVSQLQNETKNYQKAIAEMRKQAVYSPLELVDFYYNAMYDLPYKQFEYINMSTQVDFSMYKTF